jgi:hypothetical protein
MLYSLLQPESLEMEVESESVLPEPPVLVHPEEEADSGEPVQVGSVKRRGAAQPDAAALLHSAVGGQAPAPKRFKTEGGDQ